MTRFARAKGSKASNEKTPDDGTPWELMKEQLLKAKKENEDSKKRQEAEKQRIENYENFLNEQKIQKRKATWCDFPEAENVNELNNSSQFKEPSLKKRKKNKAKNQLNAGIENDKLVETKHVEGLQSESNENTGLAQIDNESSKKKKKNKKHTIQNNMNSSNDEATVNGNIENKNVPTVGDLNEHKSSSETVQKINKKKKNKNKKSKSESANASQNTNDNTDTNNDVQGSEINTDEKQTPQNKTKKNKGKKSSPNGDNKDKSQINKENKIKALKKKKEKKLVDGRPVRRKEINDKTFQLIINGKDVELVRFEGFPIMRKDADRLEELKRSMMKKGIPKSEVQRTLKLERRRAEKALARLKRDVCYNCRKGGHNLSDCPELKSKIPGVDGADGVCFKCGSTEHRQFECKVQRGKEFRFATCFICKEQGHIARECPDNPKGLYPNGGCCKLCGDVTHLRKDCPTANDKKEETSMKLQTLDSTDNIEDIGQKTQGVTSEGTMKKPKKINF